MPIFITQGRFTPEALKGMLAKPEDREAAVQTLFAQTGGTLLSYYMTFGDYDFLVVSQGPYEGVATATLAVAASGSVTDLKTTFAMTSAEMREAFVRAASVASHYRSAGSA